MCYIAFILLPFGSCVSSASPSASMSGGIKDIIGFHGDSVAVLHESFVEAVEDYLKTCESLSREPNRPYSGQFRLRLDPELHARAAIAAERKGKSLNTWVAEAIQNQMST